METNGSYRQVDAFWNFLAYLKRYVGISKSLLQSSEEDLIQTQLSSALAECMYPVLRADISFVGYRDMKKKSVAWLNIIEESIRPQTECCQTSLLIQHLKPIGWGFPCQELEQMQGSAKSVVFFDQQLERVPTVFRGWVTALAISSVMLQERKYFLFFCDINDNSGAGVRYTEFDKAMLDVAIGVLESGFESGVWKGRQFQKYIDEERTKKLLSDLVCCLEAPIEVINTDAHKQQRILARLNSNSSALLDDFGELIDIAGRNLDATNKLGQLSNTILSTLRTWAQPCDYDHVASEYDETRYAQQNKSIAEEFDVFLCYSDADILNVQRLAQQLKEAGISCWLSEERLIPGDPWQEMTEQALDKCQIVAVFVGPGGFEAWHNEQMRSAIEERVKDKSRRVIPVLLPGADSANLPAFLRRLRAVDLRKDISDHDEFRKLARAIKNTRNI